MRKKLGLLKKSSTSSTSSSLATQYLPAIYQPTVDIEGTTGFEDNNDLIYVYYWVHDEYIYSYYLPGYYVIEVTLVFRDEDHPNPEKDLWYDVYRLSIYLRIEDIETFFIVINKQTGETTRLSFIGLYLWINLDQPPVYFAPIYSSSTTFFNEDGAHERAKITSFVVVDGEHPVIYINTWNHAMAEFDNNPDLSKIYIKTWAGDVPLVMGTRLNAENGITGENLYIIEDLEEVP